VTGGVDGQIDGPAAGARDNAAENAAPSVADDVLGAGATDDLDPRDVSALDPGDQSAHGGDLSGGALTNQGLPDDVPQDRDVVDGADAAR
jgi:hypothetical protein